jgi:uncharacterized protein
MRKFVLTALSFIFFLSLGAQTLNPQDSAWIRDNYNKKEIMIPMRDGIKLFTAVYTPKNNSDAHPILMNRTPYSCAPYGENNFKAFWDNQWRYYMRGIISGVIICVAIISLLYRMCVAVG